MIGMTNNVQVQTSGPMGRGAGGLFRGLKRAVLGGETFFTNTFTAIGSSGEVMLAPALCGDMIVHELRGDQLFIQGSSYVAAPDSVQIDTRWQGFRGFLSGETLFFLQAHGHGPVLINAFGAIETIDLDGELVLDTGHLVAFTSGIDYEIGTASSGLIASWLSGEGFVLKMFGRGRLYVQSRNPEEYGRTVGGRLPPVEG
jgi:uncharacterized protein (TIGR00266 family)